MLRDARKKDAQEILELFNSDPNIAGNNENREEYDIEDIKDYIKKDVSKMIVYEEDKIIVAALLAQFWKNYIYINSLIVKKQHQGQGLGQKLLAHIEQLAKQEQKCQIEIEVIITNKRMQKLVEKTGYKKQKLIAFYSKKLK
ncbi:GNAT family N-acetyltransferase [Candidatus Pacearchaeota archaeon]|nr:GNAT family N-acetyltransferase [Candidatus Pacearchaeota archaeon]